MAVLTRRRARQDSAPTRPATLPRKISNASIIRGVEVEFDRTLPFWRCYTDLQLETRRKPKVTNRTTQLLCRIPCKCFKQVDVVWARTDVELQRAVSSPPAERGAPTRVVGQKRARSPASAEAAHNTDASTVHYTIDTLHFVHQDAFKKGPGSNHSFHVQSVILRDAPAILQCVAGAMVSFSFLVYTALRLTHACTMRGCCIRRLGRDLQSDIHACKSSHHQEIESDGTGAQATHSTSSPSSAPRGESTTMTEASSAPASPLRRWCPPSATRVLILGMGGNSMAVALRMALGPGAHIEVVEVEPAVVAACKQVGTLRDDDANTTVHLQDANTCFATLPDGVYDFIYMDVFEPMKATMQNLHPWVIAAREKLKAGGLLVTNEHQLPSAEALAPYGAIFGDGNVQAVNLRGWNESIVVCVAPGDAQTDKQTLGETKSTADVAFNIYEALMPGWLPHYSWLVKATTHRHQGVRCRLWAS